ncbi:hypothetical protein ACPESR_12515 [Nocardia testacea]|uniref:hypothetical protein n=1 Tax=Nocardia testacea TaxID=248551 RepID=UPI003C2D3924
MGGRARLVFGAWLVVLIALGAAAPSVFTSLAGACWQADGSESVHVREESRWQPGVPEQTSAALSDDQKMALTEYVGVVVDSPSGHQC